jgi:hypothetical protein
MVQKIIPLVLVLLFVSVLPAAAAAPDKASAAQWRQAETYLQNRQAQEAYPIFSALVQRYPGHSSLKLGLARSAALTGRYQEADTIYQELLRNYPGDPTLLNESQQVKALLAGAESASAVNFRMRAGIMYDSNANQGAPNDLSFDLGNWRFVIPGTKKIGTMAGYFGANFNLARRLPGDSPWSFVGDAGIYIRGNEDSDLDDIRSSEWQWVRLAAGFRYTRDRNLFEFRVKGEVFDYDLTNHVWSWGPELTYLRAVTPSFHLISQLGVDWREYQRNPDRDGHYGQLAQHARYFFGDTSHSLTFGLAYLWGRPDLHGLGYNGWSVPVRLTLRFNDTWEISPHASFTSEMYKDPAVILEREDRRDKKFRTGLDISYKLTEQLRLELNYSYNRNDSNSIFYDYSQHTAGLGVSWGF